MKKRIFMILTVVFAVIISSCSDDNNTDDPAKKAYIISINPSSASIGEIITIVGTNFGVSQNISLVSFTGALVLDYISWCDTLIKVKVPVGATSGKLWVVVGTEKSNDVDFKLNAFDDYESVTIGKQVWMVKNLDVDHYRNGDPIPQVTAPNDWKNLKTGAWCFFNNDSTNSKIYGRLYNFYAVKDPRGLAPDGWHIPSDEEWTTLINYLGGDSVAGGKLKEAGTKHWINPNIGATNESGFSALPGGWRLHDDGSFLWIGKYGSWWSAEDESLLYSAWYRYQDYYAVSIGRHTNYNGCGLSVRCVKD